MKMKKLGACAIALATATALCAPAAAFAADGTVTAPGGTSSSTITGTIAATTLSVSVPTAAAFTIDPTVEATTVNSQLKSVPDNYTVTNASVVPVYAYISGCAVAKGADMTGTPTLVTATADLSTANAVMFAVKDDTGKPTDFDTPTDWLTTTPGKYYPITANGKLAAKNDTATDEATMKFYGQTTTGWTNGDTFTITPTFTIAVTDPTK